MKKAVLAMKIAGAAIVLLGIVYATALCLCALSVKNARAELKKDGRPMKVEEIIPPAVKDADNAALSYEAAIKILESMPDAENILRGYSSQDFEKEKESLKKLLSEPKIAMALSLVEEATAKPACRFNLDYSKGPAAELPHLSPLRYLCRLLSIKAALEAESGNGEAAWKTARTALKLSDALHEEPFLVSQLVRNAMLSNCVDAIEKAGEASAPSEAMKDEILKSLKSFEDLKPFAKSMDGERLLLGEWAFKNGINSDGSSSRSMAWLMELLPSSSLDKAFYLRTMKDYAERLEKCENRKNDYVPPSPFYFFSNMLLPSIGNCEGKLLGQVAKARICAAALKALDFKKSNGRLPERLDEIVQGQDGADPFTGKELIYKTDGKGFEIYSVGPNRKDDGGLSRDKDADAVPGGAKAIHDCDDTSLRYPSNWGLPEKPAAK